MICRICGKEYKGYLGLAIHLKVHQVNSKVYYDKFFKKENEGVCVRSGCGSKTNFCNLKQGYYKHCSIKCKNSDPDVIASTRKLFLEKYGVDHPWKLEEVKERRKKTWLKNYGVENPGQSEEIKEKKKKTLMKKYGVAHQALLESVKSKKKETNIEKYGVEYPWQCKAVREKSRNSWVKKYGVDNPQKSKEVREKTKKTCLVKYGVESIGQAEEIKEKRKETFLTKYGVENLGQRESHKNYMKNGGAAIANSGIKNPSKPQVELFTRTKELFPDAILNYPCLNYSIDVAIPSLKVAIEYDEPYWHKNEEKDRKRQLEIEQQGWRFIRYRSYIPRKEELIKVMEERE